MKLKNSIYYIPYQQLIKANISFADFAKRKPYYNEMAFLFEKASSGNLYTRQEANFASSTKILGKTLKINFLNL